MALYQSGDRVRVRRDATSTIPDYIRGETATIETVLENPDEYGVQQYRVRVDRFPDHIYQAGMRRHHNLPEDGLEPADS